MIEAIILAGGMGTRLQSVVSDVPKPMADIAGKPFLEYLLTYLARNGIRRVILSVGYKSDQIIKHFGSEFCGLKVVYSVEQEPLGTGGAFWQALKYTNTPDIFLLNGDSFFDVDLQQLLRVHVNQLNDITLALKPMEKFDRYGNVTVVNGRVETFHEKQFTEKGLINAGVYVVKACRFDLLRFPKKFSLEADFLAKHNIVNIKMGSYVSDTYFIDIGIPDDYQRAQHELLSLGYV